MNGILLVDKPKGWTSFDVVAKVRSLVRNKTGLKRPKVGHAGTLDPLATGLLIILVGDYCKRASEYSKLDKVYEVELELGKTSTTDDAEGDIAESNTYRPTLQEVNGAIKALTGTIEQVPPAFSAIKIDGKRAYKLAREGKTPEIKARIITIHSIGDLNYDYPKMIFITQVSSGTYIRSLVRDLGQKLDSGAYMTGLRRTSIGDFKIEDAHQIDSITADNIGSKLA